MRVTATFTAIVGGLLGAFMLNVATVGMAADDARPTRQTVAMSERVYKRLQAIQQLLETKQFDAAAPKLNELQSLAKLSPYERAQIHNITAYFHYLQEQYVAAIRAYRRLLEQEPLPEALVQSTLRTLAQLYFTVGQYEQVITPIKRLLSMLDEPEAELHALLGSAYFQLKRYDDALPSIQSAIDIDRKQGNVPKESWLLLVRVIYHERRDYKNMLSVLKELATHYPKNDYLRAMAGAYSELGDTRNQLAVTEALYEGGGLRKPSELVNLANLYLLHGIPYKAAKLLQAELDAGRLEPSVRHLRLLSQAWYQAREEERAIPPLRSAARRSEDGELYLRLAQSYMDLERWEAAADALRRALDKGGIQRVDTANIMLGMALFNQGQFDLARDAFEKAGRDQRSRKVAGQWVAYIDHERRRMAAFEQQLPSVRSPETRQLLEQWDAGGAAPGEG